MLGYHCKLSVSAVQQDIFSFNTIEMSFHIIRGWLQGMENCVPGGWI